MSELELFKIISTASLTIFGGIVVLTAGQIITRFFIQPIHEWLMFKGELTDSLIYCKNIYLNPGNIKQEIWNETYKELRRRASQLMAKTYAIRCYRFWELLKIVHCHQNIKKVQSNLIFLSNSLDRAEDFEENRKRLEEIIRLLKMEGWV